MIAGYIFVRTRKNVVIEDLPVTAMKTGILSWHHDHLLSAKGNPH
jgi:hypothetical protein